MNLREDGTQYVLTNILPNIREILEKTETVMVIFKQKQDVVEAYDVEIIKDATLEFDDFLMKRRYLVIENLRS